MIIKRRVTRGFVQIANEVVRDRRLALDEHGLLHYLLSLPDDWEVNLKQIEKYWSIGRDKRRRLFRALKKTGWARLERIESDEGIFLGQRWIIGDEPGPEITDESLGDEDDSEDADDATPTMNATAAPESQAPDVLASGSRETPFQAVGSPDRRETRPPENTVLPRRKTSEEYLPTTNTSDGANLNSNDAEVDDGEPPPLFGEVLRLWPSDHVRSAFACEKSFQAFAGKLKIQALHGIKPYLADCREKGQNRLCDLRTYLDERRFEKFASKGPTGVQFWVAKRGTPQAERWREHLRKNDPAQLRVFEMLLASSGGYTTKTEWPPPIDPLAKTA